jgi:hypothetical protein
MYRWPAQGWVLGTVVRVSRAAASRFSAGESESHGVRLGVRRRYHALARESALGVGEAASLLDAPSGLGPPPCV